MAKKLPPTVAMLAKLLEEDGRTVYQLAQDSGVSRQTIANLLDGSGAKTIAALEALGDALGHDLTWRRRR